MRSVVILVALLAVSCCIGSSVGQTAPIGSYSYYDAFNQPYDVVTDSSGNVYVADHGAQTVFKLPSSISGAYSTQYVTSSPAIAYPDGLCLDSNANVYVVDGNNQRVVRFNNDGTSPTVIASNATTNPPLLYPWNCAIDSTNSYIYISNTVGSDGIANPNAIGGINKVSLTAPYTQAAYFTNNVTSGAVPFKYPNQVAIDNAGNLYVADSNNFHVAKISATTGAQSAIFPMSIGSYLNGVAVDSAGTVYVTDTVNNKVVVFSASGANVFNITTSNPPLNGPRGIWVDSSLNVYVADSGAGRIVKFFSSQSGWTGGFGGGSTQPAATPVNGYNVVSLYPSSNSLTPNNPLDVALDGSNNIYVADTNNNRVLKLASGTSASVQQVYTSNPALSSPNGVCLDTSNNVYVVDTNNQRVVRFNNDGTSPTVIASNATTNPPLLYPWNCVIDSTNSYIYISNTVGNTADGNANDIGGVNKVSLTTPYTQVAFFNNNVTAGATPVKYPNQIAMDSAGYLYVADSNNAVVVKLDPSTGAQQSTYTMPSNSYPNGVAVDKSGNVFASDTAQASFFVFSPNGTRLLTFALANTSQSLNNPRGMAVDGSGNIYVADSGNNRIVVFQKGSSSGAASLLQQSAMWTVLALATLLSLAFSL